MANRLVRITPVTAATSTPDAGNAFNKINVQPITGLADGAGVCVDMSENIYVTDYTKHVIYRYRRGDSASKIFAGAYNQSGSADGAYSVARFNQPSAICCDKSGNLYVVDAGNALIRRIDQNANVYTVASIPAASGQPGDIAVDASGNIFYIDSTP